MCSYIIIKIQQNGIFSLWMEHKAKEVAQINET